MTAKDQYHHFSKHLAAVYETGEAAEITDRVFESVALLKKQQLIKNPLLQLNDEIINRLNIALSLLLQHMPVQYVLGACWFYNLKLKVNANVLIPRPETEELVELVLKELKPDQNKISILDIGTGSGCIPIALKKNYPAAAVTAIDFSEKALQLAKENATLLGTDIQFIQIDFLDESQWEKLAAFDIIISNPPYIPELEKHQLAANVIKYEPHSALFVPDERPLIFYEKIALFGKTHLKRNGKIYLETHAALAKEAAAIFVKDDAAVEIKKDMFGKERMLIISY